MRSTSFRRRSLCTLPLLGAAALAAPLVVTSCTADTEEATVRSLERTGQFTFICMGPPGDASVALRPMSDCNNIRFEEPVDFNTTSGTGTHVYALVTLETRGELAVVDVTAKSGNVLDHDISTPGDNPLPVGAQPVDVVATPLGTAAFVASAEPSRPAIYAIGAEFFRPCEVDVSRCDVPPPTLSSWPQCRLPSTPGSMVLVADPANEEGGVRDTCAGDYEAVEEGPAFGDIDREGYGRQKLYVTLPREGRVVVIDAQRLFTSDPGGADDCEIEASIDLETDVPEAPADPEIMPRQDCAVPETVELRPSGDYGPSVPGGIALSAPPKGGTPGASGAKLYVSDIGVPMIHVLDLADPCEPVETTPLLPTSIDDPARVVLTDRVAVSGLTPSERRYLYATDVQDKSVMAFDLSEGVSTPRPLVREHPEYNPFQPPDRTRFVSAPVDLFIVARDLPEKSSSGVTPFGVLCDPSECEGDCSLAQSYQPSDDFETGAGPATLRGVFAVVALASGQLGVIDIEDFDKPCRGPEVPSLGAGCAEGTESGPGATDEPSCNAVAPHEPRSSFHLLANDDVGHHEPGIQTFPVLSLEDGTVVIDGPAMRVPQGALGSTLVIGGEALPIENGGVTDDEGLRNTLVMRFQNPRVHQVDQEWALTYQGALPGFAGKVGDMRLDARLFIDTTARFCDRGVQSRAAVRAKLVEEGVEENIDATASRLADRVHIAEPLAPQDAPQWDNAECSFADCRATFGEATVPTASRDIPILEALEDRLELGSPVGTTEEFFECCFPTLVDYEIRAGDEWILVGGSAGFLHNVIAEPETGVCRPSCDTTKERRAGRARYVVSEDGELPTADDPRSFDNALFQFVVVVPPNPEGSPDLERDMAFRWITDSSFVPLRVGLTSDGRRTVQVSSVGYISAFDEFVVTDGALEGVLLVPGDLVGDIRQFY